MSSIDEAERVAYLLWGEGTSRTHLGPTNYPVLWVVARIIFVCNMREHLKKILAAGAHTIHGLECWAVLPQIATPPFAICAPIRPCGLLDSFTTTVSTKREPRSSRMGQTPALHQLRALRWHWQCSNALH